MGRIYTFVADDNDAGRQVGAALRSRGISGGAIKRAKGVENGICVDGQAVFSNAVLRAGQAFSVMVQDDAGSAIEPVAGPVDIVHEDGDLLVLNKPAGLAVHPGPGNPAQSLGNYVAHYVLQKTGEAHVFRPVNRLDRPTSGLMVAAKNAHAHAALVAQMREGEFQRSYLALVMGSPDFDTRRIELPIGRKPGSALMRQVRPDGARAVTNAQVLCRGQGISLVAFFLETGRTHQIRVHMAQLGHPLYGDFLYGKEEQAGCMLHARALRLRSIENGEELAFFAPPPEVFFAVAREHGVDVAAHMRSGLGQEAAT